MRWKKTRKWKRTKIDGNFDTTTSSPSFPLFTHFSLPTQFIPFSTFLGLKVRFPFLDSLYLALLQFRLQSRFLSFFLSFLVVTDSFSKQALQLLPGGLISATRGPIGAFLPIPSSFPLSGLHCHLPSSLPAFPSPCSFPLFLEILNHIHFPFFARGPHQEWRRRKREIKREKKRPNFSTQALIL